MPHAKIKGQPEMLIKELQRHFPARIPEWFNACTMFCWGAYILLHPGIFANNPVFEAFISMAWTNALPPERVQVAENLWGLVTVWVGMLRAFALFVNGSFSRTPMIRLIASAISAFIWAQMAVGFMRLGEPNPGLIMYSAAVGLDLISAYRAGVDVATAELTRRGNSGVVKRGKFGEHDAVGVR